MPRLHVPSGSLRIEGRSCWRANRWLANSQAGGVASCIVSRCFRSSCRQGPASAATPAAYGTLLGPLGLPGQRSRRRDPGSLISRVPVVVPGRCLLDRSVSSLRGVCNRLQLLVLLQTLSTSSAEKEDTSPDRIWTLSVISARGGFRMLGSVPQFNRHSLQRMSHSLPARVLTPPVGTPVASCKQSPCSRRS